MIEVSSSICMEGSNRQSDMTQIILTLQPACDRKLTLYPMGEGGGSEPPPLVEIIIMQYFA